MADLKISQATAITPALTDSFPVAKLAQNTAYKMTLLQALESLGTVVWPDTLGTAITDASAGDVLYLKAGVYSAATIDKNITLVALSPKVIIRKTTATGAALTITSPCTLIGIRTEHTGTAVTDFGIYLDGVHSIEAYNCQFYGGVNAPAIGTDTSSAKYYNCEFETTSTAPGTLGTRTWSPGAEFHNCVFSGVYGVDAQDSKFYSCHIIGEDTTNGWGIHMPLGTLSDDASASGYGGTAEFYNCTIISKGSGTYAVGLGNSAHPKFFGCYIEGVKYGIYWRNSSTFLAENCYIKTTAAASSAFMASKLAASEVRAWAGYTGISYARHCTIEGATYDYNVPDLDTRGSLTIDYTVPSTVAADAYVDTGTDGTGTITKFITAGQGY